MERLTKRVGVNEAVPVCDFDICAPFVKSGLCKTGSQGFPYSRWEMHCNDTCILGRMIDRLADYEDTGLTPEEIKAIFSTTELRIHRELTNAEVEEIRQMLRQQPATIMLCAEDKADVCVCCGEIIPEGRQVCPTCEKEAGL